MAPATAGVQAMGTGKRSAGHPAAFRRINGMGTPDSGGFGRKQMKVAAHPLDPWDRIFCQIPSGGRTFSSGRPLITDDRE